MRTAKEAKVVYQQCLADIEIFKNKLKEARTAATVASNEYGRACREELRASQAKPAEEKS